MLSLLSVLVQAGARLAFCRLTGDLYDRSTRCRFTGVSSFKLEIPGYPFKYRVGWGLSRLGLPCSKWFQQTLVDEPTVNSTRLIRDVHFL